MRFVIRLLGRFLLAVALAGLALVLLLPVAGIGFAALEWLRKAVPADRLELVPGFHVHSGTVVLVVGSLLAFGMLCVVLILIVVAARTLASAFGSREGAFEGSRLQPDEVEAMQQLHRGFNRLEERVEALETILLERSGKDRAGRNGKDRREA